jgi:hypothetical protein
MAQDPHGHLLWWAGREQFMMRRLDRIADALGPDDRLILMGHNVHLSMDASRLHLHPQQSSFWGFRSRLRALGYEAHARLIRCPANTGLANGSIGSHLHAKFPGQVLSIWMLYGQGSLMMPRGPRVVRLHGDTVESLLARVGDRFLLPLNDAGPQAKAILQNANLRLSWGSYVSADLSAQADAVCFVRDVHAE